MLDKTTIRQEMRARRKALPPDAKARASDIICDKILAHPDVAAALDPLDGWGALAVYLASSDEIDLTAAIEEMLTLGVTVVAPRWNGETYELAKLKSLHDADLRKGPMGILEPKDADIVPSKGVAVWLVPGLAFTRGGKRLGYGGGWYDRLMAEAAKGAMRIGVAHAFQAVEDLPNEPHDIRVDSVLDDSLEHPQVDYAELPDGCRVRVSVAHRRRWWTAFFGGMIGVCLFPVLVKGALALERGHLALGGGIALLVLGALAVLAGAIALLYAFGGPFEAELELHGEQGLCRRRWLGLVPRKTLRFKWNPWTRFEGGGCAFYNAPGKSLLSVGEGAVVRPLFRTDAEIAQRLSIRLNHSRVISPERWRAAREKLLSQLPRGMTITHDADGTTVSVRVPSLIRFDRFFIGGLFVLTFVSLLLLFLFRWPVLMVTLQALVGLLFAGFALRELVWSLFGHYRLTIRGDSCTYVKRIGGRGREQTFSMASCAPARLQGSCVSLVDTAGGLRTLFDDLPPRYYLYLEQFIRQEMASDGR